MRHKTFSSPLEERIHVFYPSQKKKNHTFSPTSTEVISNIKTNIEVYDMFGVQVYHKLLDPLTGKQSKSEIKLPYQPGGLYLYGIVAENGNLIEEGKLIYF